MRGKSNPELKAECIRLRVEERLSLREIHQRTGASKGSLSGWLKEYPLTREERAAKRKANQRGGTPKKPRGEESPLHQMMNPQASRLQKAKIAEAAVLFRMTVCGFNVFGSPFDGDKADWLVEIPETGRIVKVQVKWAAPRRKTSNCVEMRLRCVEGHNKSRTYRKGDFDFIVGYDLYTDTCYVWSWDEVSQYQQAITVSEEAAENWEKMRT